jgi:hypothetical protein
MRPNQRDRDQVADLILSDPANGEECYVMTPIEAGVGSSMVFEVCSKENRYRVTIEIEELV